MLDIQASLQTAHCHSGPPLFSFLLFLTLAHVQSGARLAKSRLPHNYECMVRSLHKTGSWTLHFMWITYAMDRIGINHDEMWDTHEGFFYDLLHFPDEKRSV